MFIGLLNDWYDYGARFYDPALGRFHTPDPIAPFIPGITPYNYAFNSPVNLVDLEGLIGDDHDPNKRDRRHRRNTRWRNFKNKIYNLFNIPHDAMANRAKIKRRSNRPNSSSTTPSGGSSSNNYAINIKEELPNDDLFSSFPVDAVKPVDIESIIPELPSTSNSIRWNDRFIDVAGHVDLQLDRGLFVGDSDAFNDNLAAAIENLFSISEYLANHPEFIVTIIVSTPKLAGTVENGVFDNQSSMEEFKRTVDNRAVRIAELIRTFFPSIKRSQIITRTETGNKTIKLRLSN